MRRVGKYPGWKDTRTLGKHTGGERLLARALTELLHPIARNAGFDESLVSAKGRAGQGDFGSKAETLLYQNLIPPASSIRSKRAVWRSGMPRRWRV